MAIDHINDKTDGLWDDILPNTQIEYLQRHSERDSGKAVVSAVEMIMTSGNESTSVCGLSALSALSKLVFSCSPPPAIRTIVTQTQILQD